MTCGCCGLWGGEAIRPYRIDTAESRRVLGNGYEMIPIFQMKRWRAGRLISVDTMDESAVGDGPQFRGNPIARASLTVSDPAIDWRGIRDSASGKKMLLVPRPSFMFSSVAAMSWVMV